LVPLLSPSQKAMRVSASFAICSLRFGPAAFPYDFQSAGNFVN
jgi:hypothetical protein